jgi:hypothetical protein
MAFSGNFPLGQKFRQFGREKKTEDPASTVAAALGQLSIHRDKRANHCTSAVPFGVLEMKSKMGCGTSVNSSFG